MQSSKAFLLLEALLCLVLLCFALLLSLFFLSHPKTFAPIQSPTLTSQSHREVILKSGELVFEGKERVWEGERGRIFVLEDLK